MAKAIKKSAQELDTTKDDGIENELAQFINTTFKKKQETTSYFLKDGIESPTDIPCWIKSGSDILDILMSNLSNGGFPTSKIVQLSGLQGSGKSFIGAHAIKNTQKMGGIGIYIDTQASVNRQFLSTIGVDLSKMLYIPLELTQDIFQTVQKLIHRIRSSQKDCPVTILIDSISGATTNTELQGNYAKSGWNTEKAIVLSASMRKITNLIGKQKILLIINSQVRTNLNASFGGQKWVTSGGMAIPFHSSIRIRLNKSTKIKNKHGQVIGMNLQAKIIKNRLAPPFRDCKIPVYFTSGINNYQSWLLLLKEYDLTNGRSIQYNGQKYAFTMGTFPNLMHQNKQLRDYVYGLICDKLIKIYNYNEGDVSEQEHEFTQESVQL